MASIIRLIVLANFTTDDPTYTQVYASTWTTFEQGVAVISGNLPLLAPLFERFLKGRGTTRYGYGSSGRTGGSDTNALGSNKWNGGLQYASRHRGGGHTHASVVRSSVGNKIKMGHDFERLSDTDSQAPEGIEMDNRAILVKTQISITKENVDSPGRRE